MSSQIDAIFENGVFRPTQSVSLSDHQRVRLTVESDPKDQVSFSLSAEAWDSFCEALDAPPRAMPELRRLLQEPGVFDARSDTPR